MTWRTLPGPGDLGMADLDRREREEARRVRQCHESDEDCGDGECEGCNEGRRDDDEEA